MWGHTVGAAVGMGWVNREKDDGENINAAWVNDGEWHVELPGKMAPATGQLRPFL